MTLRIGRAIFVALLAVAIATLPASVGFAAGAAMATDTVVTQAMPMPDCDHHHHNAPNGTTQKTAHDGACLAACAVACFGFAAATNVSGIAYLAPVSAALKPLRASTAISSLMGTPPFRPPRS